ncbi:MAG: MFS transporter [Bacteroidales bacterium]|jgi:PAT family beta-lactamase induction signal transducer AmpG|nr:MFS transporter [Bacteroidales bacterium]
MNQKNKHPLSWLCSLYFAEGLPYMMVVVVSTVMYKNLGVSNTDIAFYTGWFYLPWVIKPFWSPFVDNIKTTRYWIIIAQLTIGILFALIGLALPLPGFFKWCIILMWLMAFSSATHDIVADGFYILGLDSHKQAKYVGFRSLFYRISMIVAQGGIVAWVGFMHKNGTSMPQAWSYAMFALAVFFVLAALLHKRILPQPQQEEKSLNNAQEAFSSYIATIAEFFQKKGIVPALLFILFYRFGEAQLSKLATPFLLDSTATGGLALSNTQVGFAYGTIGVIGLIIGGVSGGLLAARHGLKTWIWPMALAMNIPNLVYVLLAHYQPENIHLIQGAIFLEQFGYGFGFTAFMLYLLSLADGKHSTAHYAFATGIMALGMMLPGMISGWIQEHIGYAHFFVWVLLCGIPGLVLIPFLKYDKNFGKKNNSNN